jgi:hypothetical protein
MTNVKGKTNICYIIGKCKFCNDEFSYKVDALNGVIK